MSKKKNLLFLDHTPFVGGAQHSLMQHIGAINTNKFNIFLGISRTAEELGLTEGYKKLRDR